MLRLLQLLGQACCAELPSGASAPAHLKAPCSPPNTTNPPPRSYAMTGYNLAPDAPAALRHRGKKGAELYRKQTLPGGCPGV